LRRIDEKLEELKNNKYLKYANWLEINKYACKDKLRSVILQKENLIKTMEKSITTKRTSDFIEEEKFEQKQLEEPDENTYFEGRNIYLTIMKKELWNLHENKEISSSSFSQLRFLIEECLEKEQIALGTWDPKTLPLINNLYVLILTKSKFLFCLGRFLRNFLFNHLYEVFDKLSGFIQAHNISENVMKEFIKNDLVIFHLIKESQYNKNQAEEYLKYHLISQFPEIIKDLHTMKLASVILEQQQESLNRHLHIHQAGKKDLIIFQRNITKSIKSLWGIAPDWKLESNLEFLKNHKLFSFFNEQQQNFILENSKTVHFERNVLVIEVIFL